MWVGRMERRILAVGLATLLLLMLSGHVGRRVLAVGLAALPPFPFPILLLSHHHIDPPQSNKNTKKKVRDRDYGEVTMLASG